MIADQNRDDFRRGYAAVMAWANAITENETEPGEFNPVEDATAALGSDGLWHITADSVPGADVVLDMTDANAFMDEAADLLYASAESDWAQHGHDFALTRNGHGAGFWDRGYGETGYELTGIAQRYAEAWVVL